MYFDYKELSNIRKFYDENGYVVIKKFFKRKNISFIKNKINNNKIKFDKNFTYTEIIKNKSRYRRIERISDQSSDVKNIIDSKKIKKTLKFLKKKKQTLFKDKLNFKYPGGGGYLPHIDGHFYWKDKNNKIKKGWSIYSDNFTNVVSRYRCKFICLLYRLSKYN